MGIIICHGVLPTCLCMSVSSSPTNPILPPTLIHSLTTNHHTLYVCLSVCLSSAHSAVHTKVLALSVFIYCSLLLCLFLVLLCSTLYPFWSCSRLGGNESVDYCALFVFLVSCDHYCSAHPHGAMCWYAVCDRDIF